MCVRIGLKWISMHNDVDKAMNVYISNLFL